jgi:hypothetical protein
MPAELPTARPPAGWFKVAAYESFKGTLPGTSEVRKTYAKKMSEADIQGIDPSNTEKFVQKIAGLALRDFTREAGKEREIRPSDAVELKEDATTGVWRVHVSWPAKSGQVEWMIYVPLGKSALRQPDAPDRVRRAFEDDKEKKQEEIAHDFHLQNKRSYKECPLCQKGKDAETPFTGAKEKQVDIFKKAAPKKPVQEASGSFEDKLTHILRSEEISKSDISDKIKALVQKYLSLDSNLKSAEDINHNVGQYDCYAFAKDLIKIVPSAKIVSGSEHTFVEYEGKYYDAETSSGVSDPNELLHYRRAPKAFKWS